MSMEETNFTDYVTQPAEAAAEAPVEAGVDGNWEERYRSEVQDRIRERERYKPIRQVFDNMHPDDAAAVQGFAQAWAAGDEDTASSASSINCAASPKPIRRYAISST